MDMATRCLYACFEEYSIGSNALLGGTFREPNAC